jgi:hypothetical protein
VDAASPIEKSAADGIKSPSYSSYGHQKRCTGDDNLYHHEDESPISRRPDGDFALISRQNIRSVDKLQREASALGQVRAYQDQTAAAKAADRIYPAGLSDLRIRYLDAVDDVLEDRVVNPGYRIWLDDEFRWWFDRRLQQYVEEGLTREQITERLGSPWELVKEWAADEGFEGSLNRG